MLERFRQRIVETAIQNGFAVSPDEDPGLIRFDCYTLVLGLLPQDSKREAVLKAVDQLLDKTLTLRKQLSAARASDIYMFMVAPLGSADELKWRALAAEIERDDRLARKHIWLPNKEGSADNFSNFLESTFLATPWETVTGRPDALAQLAQDVDMPEGWESVLLNPDLEGIELVKELIKLESAGE